MIAGHIKKTFCCEDVSKIENYEKAISDDTQTWVCHHRLETDLGLSVDELKEKNLYFNRPASELIFLTNSEHVKLHNTGKPSWNKGKFGEESHRYGTTHSEETKQKMSEKKQEYFKTHNSYWKGKKLSEETIEKCRQNNLGEKNPMFGKNPEDFMTQEAIELKRKRMSESAKRRWQKYKEQKL